MNRKKLQQVAIPVAVVLCVASVWLPAIQSVATILLLLVTFEYVLLTQENIELFRRQLQRQENVYVNFDLIFRNGLVVRVANLGISNFLVAAVHVRAQDIGEFRYTGQEIVQSGTTVELNLPEEVCAEHPLSVDLEITLECVGLDVRRTTKPQCFNVLTDEKGIPQDVKGRGFHGLWTVTCPKCQKVGLPAMSTSGLKTFDEAVARKSQVAADFHNSCPKHDSKFLLRA